MSAPAQPRESPIDGRALRAQVRAKYVEVAEHPDGEFHFHTGSTLAARCGYPSHVVADVPGSATERFAGVASPFSVRALVTGERVVDVGCGAGFDSLLAARAVGPRGAVIGIDMTEAMLTKARAAAAELGAGNVEFRHGFAEALPAEDGWADVVISNGVFNLCVDKRAVLEEARRVLRPGGVLQFADIATDAPIPEDALRQIDLWTG